ncbi:MAG TPA: DUF1552 domain-containing protein [Polyangia bacterium]|nr:DUF1552 domain-containing protein [Polyangia bacterium]
MKSTNWTRRQVLKGAGVALSVPWLETFAAKKADAATSIRRYMALYFPNGTASAFWSPSGSGTSMTLSPILSPLQPNISKALVLGNVSNYLPWNGHIEPSHGNNMATAWTGVRAHTVPQSTEGNFGSSISVDQQIAQTLIANNNGKSVTPLDSLQVGLSTLDSYTDGLPGPHSRSVSWKSAGEPLYKVVSPQAVFQHLMAGGFPTGTSNMTPTTDGSVAKAAKLKQSALDYIIESSNSLKLRLSTSDNIRLDQFLSSVKTLEARVTASNMPGSSTSVAGCVVPNPAPSQVYNVGSVPPDYNRGTHATLMIDLAVLAFQCDMTRVISFMLDDARSDFVYNFMKVRDFTKAGLPETTANVDGYHGLQHTSDSNSGFATIGWWNASRANELVTKISNIKEGSGSAMDGTVIHFMSGMNGGNHDSKNLPLVLLGSGGGVLKQGQYINFPASAGPNMSGKNLQDVHLTIINKVFNGNLPAFGTAMGAYVGTQGVLTDILA